MKNKKTVTEAVRIANRNNSGSSTGPRTEKGKSISSENALRHSILARRIHFVSAGQRRRYQELWRRWVKDLQPQGRLEKFFVEEIAHISWKLGIVESLEVRELLKRREPVSSIDEVFHELDLPVDNWDSPLNHGMECERLLVRAVKGNDSHTATASRSPMTLAQGFVNGTQASLSKHNQENGHVEVQAVMGSSLGTMARYRSSLKRDLYRAIEILRSAQAERHKREEVGED